jgi:hypothetical protein
VGREGFEPSTLGLRVRPTSSTEPQDTETPCNEVVPEPQLTTCHAAYGDKLVRASVLAPNRSEPTQRKALLEAYIAAMGQRSGMKLL